MAARSGTSDDGPSGESVVAPAPAATRTRLLEAAISLVAAEGTRGLTHRRLEDHAKASRGSARYHLGSHDEIVAAALDHLAEAETAAATQALDDLAVANLGRGPVDPQSMARAVTEMLGKDQDRTRARFAFMLEASRAPHLQEVVRRWRASFQNTAAAALGATGSTDPAMDARLLIATMDGLLLEHLATGDPTLGQATEAAVDRLLRSASLPGSNGTHTDSSGP